MNKYQTEQRQKLIDLFKNSNHQSFSANDILNLLNNDDISISAIYRNLKAMDKDGLICKVVEKGRSEALYQYVDPYQCAGVIHLKCETCENTYHINRHISQMVIGIANDEFDFKINNSSAFIYGTCRECANK